MFFILKGAYPTPATCDYHITGRIGTSVNITFLNLDLPRASNCSDVDHIVIYSIIRGNGGNVTYSEVTKVCGDTIPDSILTYSSNALVKFITKSSNSLYSGFRFKFQSSIDICGGTILASTGILQSPGYPASQDATRLCEWTITVPKGRRVKVEILDFDVKPSPAYHINAGNSVMYLSSDQTRVTFYNDFYMSSQISSLPSALMDQSKPIYSSDNTMRISAWIRRSNVGYRGFKLRFSSNEPTICIGDLNELSGIINSPENVTRFYCEYIRSSHEQFIANQSNVGTIGIKVIEQSIFSGSTQCRSSLPTGITIAFNNDRRTLYTKCTAKYENIASPFSNTKIILKNMPTKKYQFQYKVHNCGGILTDTMTRITIPIQSNNYGELDCGWQYTTQTDRIIQMVINAPAMNCDTEYVNLYRGRTSSRPRIARICGDSPIVNQTMIVSAQSTYIEYHNDNYDTIKSSFQIDIITSDGICGGNLEAPNYIFSSPKNGTKYPANTECEWNIRAQNGYHIGLTFINRFLIETSPSCQKDYIQVFDKINGEYIARAKICGRNFPKYLNSTGQEMKVVFHSDGNGDGDGFTAQWTENCGGIFRATSQPQYITSPRFPDSYPKNAYCNYSIVGMDGESISVKFLKFDLEATNSLCNFDNVTIYKYPMFNWVIPMEEVGTYCMNGSVSTFRYTHRIDVVFRTDSFIERSGFKFVYNTDQCGGNVTESTMIGSLHDNETDNDVYLPLTTCVWFITAPSDKKILIRFEQFDIEYMLGCHVDYVDVFSGHQTNDKQRKARLCGNITEHTPAITIDSNTATVKFVTDATVQEKGFTALILFTKNCNKFINLTSNNPQYLLNEISEQYEPLLNCEYFVNAPKGYVIQVKFQQMDIHPCTMVNSTCTCDYLIIRDGFGPFAESFGRFCGKSHPPDIQTTTSDLYMQFVTDNISFGTGFSVLFEMIESPCGQSNYHLNGTLSSVTVHVPVNGQMYKPNMNCLWSFTTDDGKLIDIKFEQFDLEEDSTNKCTADYLEISDEEVNNYIFCSFSVHLEQLNSVFFFQTKPYI